MITAEGQLNTCLGAQGVVQHACEQLPEKEFGNAKRLLKRDQTLAHLDTAEENSMPSRRRKNWSVRRWISYVLVIARK